MLQVKTRIDFSHLLCLVSKLLQLPVIHSQALPSHLATTYSCAVSAVQAAWTQSSWVSSKDDTSDPGWMLPIIVLCRVYATYLNTTPDTHTHRQHRPLPLDQLYNPDAPAAGLLPLLKFALWQTLWVESPSSECLVPICFST